MTDYHTMAACWVVSLAALHMFLDRGWLVWWDAGVAVVFALAAIFFMVRAWWRRDNSVQNIKW